MTSFGIQKMLPEGSINSNINVLYDAIDIDSMLFQSFLFC